MKREKVLLQPEQMRAIARYETDFAEIAGLPEDYDGVDDYVELRECYQYTLEDLREALRNLIAKNPTVGELANRWLFPLWELAESFGVAAGDRSRLNFDEDVAPDCIRGLPLTGGALFDDLWRELGDTYQDLEEEDRVADYPELPGYLREIEQFYADCDKPVSERTFSDRQKGFYVFTFTSDTRLEHATETELELCRRFTDELCEKGFRQALRLKGYACYGGNRLYGCDWAASRDCILRLYEMTDEPMYANTLGYIYYYGRCTGGEPEYEKAFEMFSVGAANGLDESTYKLGDMYMHGYACRKSPRTAKALYTGVYNRSRRSFLDGYGGCFADAALRWGNVYLQEDNPWAAYYYFLEADYAHRKRMKESDFFGHTTVAVNIRKGLEETRAKLGEDFFTDHVSRDMPDGIFDLLEDRNRISLLVEKSSDGDTWIRAARVPVRRGEKVTPILLTEPEIDLCELTTTVVLRGVNVSTSFRPEEDGPALIDCAEWNDEEQRTDFYFADKLVGWIACDEYRMYGPMRKPIS